MLIRRLGMSAMLLFVVVSAAQVGAEDKTVKVKAIELQIPDGWEEQSPDNRLRLAQFSVKPAEGEEAGEMYVSAFGGDGGGVAANVSRWVKQFDAEGREVTVVQGKSDAGEYVMADIKGTFNKSIGPPIQGRTQPVPDSRMLAAIVKVGNENYFLKLTGGQKTIEKQVENFRKSFKADKETEKPYEQ